MIDLKSETLVPIAEVPARLITRPHLSTVHRWSDRGVRGARLETVLVGGRRCTSQEALARFLAKLNGQPTASLPPSAIRQREISTAKAELASAGY